MQKSIVALLLENRGASVCTFIFFVLANIYVPGGWGCGGGWGGGGCLFKNLWFGTITVRPECINIIPSFADK